MITRYNRWLRGRPASRFNIYIVVRWHLLTVAINHGRVWGVTTIKLSDRDGRNTNTTQVCIWWSSSLNRLKIKLFSLETAWKLQYFLRILFVQDKKTIKKEKTLKTPRFKATDNRIKHGYCQNYFGFILQRKQFCFKVKRLKKKSRMLRW